MSFRAVPVTTFKRGPVSWIEVLFCSALLGSGGFLLSSLAVDSNIWPAPPVPPTSPSLLPVLFGTARPVLWSLRPAEEHSLLDLTNLANLFLQLVPQLTVLFSATPHRSRGQLPVYLYHTGQHMTAALCCSSRTGTDSLIVPVQTAAAAPPSPLTWWHH